MDTVGKKANKKYVYGLYDHEDKVLHAVDKIRGAGIEIDDVYSPFPIHGIDPKLGLKESRLHTAGFLFGLTGTVTALSLISWISVSNYPTVFGGKPLWSLPSYIPITFELTVLMAGVGMFFVYCFRNELWPGHIPMILDSRTTDDKFALAFGTDELSEDKVSKIKTLLQETGAEEINFKEFKDEYEL